MSDPFGPPDILVVGINYFPESTGIAPYTTAMAEALASAGMSVHVLTGIPHYPSWRVQDERYSSGVRWEESIRGLPVTRVAHAVPPRATLAGRVGMESSFFWRARQAIAQLPARAIIAVTPSLSGVAAALAAAHNRPVGVVVQDLTGAGAAQSGSASQSIGRGIAAVEYSLLRRADAVGVITMRFAAALSANGIDSSRLMDVSNFSHVAGIDMDPQQARDRLGWHHDGIVVVHSGNMGMKQGLESVVAAAQLAEERAMKIDFVLVGNGNQRDGLQDMARGCRRLHILDPVDEDDYPCVLAAADILLLNERPGVSEMSMPSKLTSYVTAARPILAAVEPGGITHSVLAEANAAALVAPGAPLDLLQGAARLGDDPQRRADLVANAASLGVRRYSRAAAETRYQLFAERLLVAGTAQPATPTMDDRSVSASRRVEARSVRRMVRARLTP